MYKILSPLAVLVIWEFLARLGLINTLILPPPSKIFMHFGEMILSMEILFHTGSSLGRVATGFALAVVTAVPLGIFMGWFRVVDTIVDPLVELIRPVSPIAILPLAILWFGIGDASKIFIIWLSCTFPILINTYTGVKGLDRSFIYAATSLGATNSELLRTVAIHAALPQIYAGIRISIGIGLIVIISSEMIAARQGLGYMILTAQQTFNVEEIFVGIIVLGMLGFLADQALRRSKQILMPWHREI
jgi:ABC-type nitrate/sulfonate/bicarbonate transport system permease component